MGQIRSTGLLFVFGTLPWCAAAQAPRIDSVRNALSLSPIFSPGSLVSISGKSFGPPSMTHVWAGDSSLEILFSSGTRIDVRLPADFKTGPANVTVWNGEARSDPNRIMVSAFAPALLSMESGEGVFLDGAGAVLRQAAPGAILRTFAAGLSADAEENTRAVGGAVLRVGDTQAQILSATELPDREGIYEIDFVVPDLEPGPSMMTLAVGNASSSGITLRVAGVSSVADAIPPTATAAGLLSWIRSSPRFTKSALGAGVVRRGGQLSSAGAGRQSAAANARDGFALRRPPLCAPNLRDFRSAVYLQRQHRRLPLFANTDHRRRPVCQDVFKRKCTDLCHLGRRGPGTER